MTWFKVDDDLSMSRKVLGIPRGKRTAAMGLWVLAGAWSAGGEHDGHVPAYMVGELDGSDESAEWLVKVGLWEAVDGGFQFVGWGEYQPTREELEAKREVERQRKAAWRARKSAGTTSGVPDVSQRDMSGSPGGVPESSALSRPDPTRPDQEISNEISSGGTTSLSSEAAIADPRPEIDHLLDLLDAEIISNGGKAPSRTSKNRDAIRLLLDRDKRTVEQVEAAIRWCQADEFWRSNILSAVKLREKYEQLRLAAARQPRSRAPSRAEERQQNNLNVVNQLAAMDAAEHRGIRS